MASNGTSNNIGAIIGGVIGGLALLCAFGIAAIYLLRRGQRQQGAEVSRGDFPKETLVEDRQNYYDGWGPKELPTYAMEHTSSQEPVELPDTPARF